MAEPTPYEKAIEDLKAYIEAAEKIPPKKEKRKQQLILAKEVLALLTDPQKQNALFEEKNLSSKTGLISDIKYRILSHKLLDYIETNKQYHGKLPANKKLIPILRALYHELPLFPNESADLKPPEVPQDLFEEYNAERISIFKKKLDRPFLPHPLIILKENEHKALIDLHRNEFKMLLQKNAPTLNTGVHLDNAADLPKNTELVHALQVYITNQMDRPWRTPDFSLQSKQKYLQIALRDAFKHLNYDAQKNPAHNSAIFLQDEPLETLVNILLMKATTENPETGQNKKENSALLPQSPQVDVNARCAKKSGFFTSLKRHFQGSTPEQKAEKERAKTNQKAIKILKQELQNILKKVASAPFFSEKEIKKTDSDAQTLLEIKKTCKKLVDDLNKTPPAANVIILMQDYNNLPKGPRQNTYLAKAILEKTDKTKINPHTVNQIAPSLKSLISDAIESTTHRKAPKRPT